MTRELLPSEWTPREPASDGGVDPASGPISFDALWRVHEAAGAVSLTPPRRPVGPGLDDLWEAMDEGGFVDRAAVERRFEERTGGSGQHLERVWPARRPPVEIWRAPPAVCVDPPDELSKAMGVLGWIWRARKYHSAEPCDAEFEGRYRTHVYRLEYRSPVETALPHGDVEAELSPRLLPDFVTWLRVDIPCFDATMDEPSPYLGVVGFVDGGHLPEKAVRAREEDEDESIRRAMAWLASGMDWEDVSFGDVKVPWFRPGAPMITFQVSQPGRGLLDDTGFRSIDMRADGAPDFLASIPPGATSHTPLNTTGADYGGTMTVAALEAAAQVVLAIVEALRGSWEEPWASAPTRLLIASRSNGLTASTHWIGSTSQRVHALVDWEGPTDSAEQLTATEGFDPLGRSPDPLPSTLDFDTWADLMTGSVAGAMNWPESYQLRPPREALADWPPAALASVRSALHAVLGDWWDAWYSPAAYGAVGFASSYPADLVAQVEAFWEHREALPRLPGLLAGGLAYIRIQSDRDHAQPEHYRWRHAIKALNAAFSGGGYGTVFLADASYEAAVSAGADPAIGPTPVEATWNEDDDTDWPAVMETFESAQSWAWHVDLLRWALVSNFPLV